MSEFADEVMLRTIECGLNPMPWQFDVAAAAWPDQPPTSELTPDAQTRETERKSA